MVLVVYDDQNDASAELESYTIAPPDKVPGAWAAFYEDVTDLDDIGEEPPTFAMVVPAL